MIAKTTLDVVSIVEAYRKNSQTIDEVAEEINAIKNKANELLKKLNDENLGGQTIHVGNGKLLQVGGYFIYQYKNISVVTKNAKDIVAFLTGGRNVPFAISEEVHGYVSSWECYNGFEPLFWFDRVTIGIEKDKLSKHIEEFVEAKPFLSDTLIIGKLIDVDEKDGRVIGIIEDKDNEKWGADSHNIFRIKKTIKGDKNA